MANEKASERAERLLTERIISGEFPPGSELPGERDLSKDIGVARPALREELQRLARDGWLEIQQGKPTQVRDFLRDGNLNILIGLLQADVTLLPEFVPDLLEMWGLLAPTYTQHALANDPAAIQEVLREFEELADRSRPTVHAQWRLHRLLIELGDNPIYGLVLNSFTEFYMRLATIFFADPDMRHEAHRLWQALQDAAEQGSPQAGAEAMQHFMTMTRQRWAELDIPALLEVHHWHDEEVFDDEQDSDET